MHSGVMEVRVARVVIVQVVLHVIGDHKCVICHMLVPKLALVPVGMRQLFCVDRVHVVLRGVIFLIQVSVEFVLMMMFSLIVEAELHVRL